MEANFDAIQQAHPELRLSEQGGEGNCGPYVSSFLLFGENVHWRLLRDLVCAVYGNPAWLGRAFPPHLPVDLDPYPDVDSRRAAMSYFDTYWTDQELQVLSSLFGVEVRVSSAKEALNKTTQQLERKVIDYPARPAAGHAGLLAEVASSLGYEIKRNRPQGGMDMCMACAQPDHYRALVPPGVDLRQNPMFTITKRPPAPPAVSCLFSFSLKCARSLLQRHCRLWLSCPSLMLSSGPIFRRPPAGPLRALFRTFARSGKCGTLLTR